MSADLPERRSVPSLGARSQSLLRPFSSIHGKSELFRRVLWRDVEASFRGSALGLLWIVLVPLVMVALYTFVFGVIMRAAWAAPTASPLEVPLIYFCGLSISGFMLEVMNRSPNFIRGHASYVKKVIFPLDMLPWVVVGTATVKLAISLGLLTIALSVVDGRFVWQVALLFVLLVPFFLLMTGLSWVLSAIGTYVRDLGHVLQVITPVLMFVSPVFYGLDQVPEAARPFYLINPLTFVLENARRVLFMDGMIDWAGFAAYTCIALIIFYLGHRFFERARPGFADVV